MLARIRKAMEENEEGFTLIELLVVVIIIGILAAIAIPTFLNQREGAWARAAQSDLRNSAVIAETYFSENGTYAALTKDDMKESDKVTLTVDGATTDANEYCITAVHANLDGKTFYLDSNEGVPSETVVCAKAD